jgi:hypothetical protein
MSIPEDGFEPFVTQSRRPAEVVERAYRVEKLRLAVESMAVRVEAAGYQTGLTLASGGDWKAWNRTSNRRLRALDRLTEALAREVTR